jgi:hypothetical protein
MRCSPDPATAEEAEKLVDDAVRLRLYPIQTGRGFASASLRHWLAVRTKYAHPLCKKVFVSRYGGILLTEHVRRFSTVVKLITPAKHGWGVGPPCPTSVLNSLLFRFKVYPSLA